MYKGIISQKTNDEPKIYPTTTGARIEIELYDCSIDELKKLVEKELEIEIRILK